MMGVLSPAEDGLAKGVRGSLQNLLRMRLQNPVEPSWA